MFYSKSGGQISEELEFDAWGFPASPGKLLNNDHGNFITASFTRRGKANNAASANALIAMLLEFSRKLIP